MKKRLKLLFLAISTAIIALLFWYFYSANIYQIIISMELKSNEPETCQLFFNSGEGFQEEKSLRISYEKNDDFNKISFELPKSKIQSIRLDPGSKSEQYEIKEITIQVGGQIESYSGNEILNHFQLINLIPANSQPEKDLLLQQINSPDAQIVFLYPLSDVFKMEDLSEKRIFLGIILILYLSIFLIFVYFGRRIYTIIKKWVELKKYSSPTILTSDYIKKYVQENRYIIIYSLLIAIFSFGYELFNFSMSIDEEIDSFRNASESYVYVFVGRWGLYFLNQFVSPHSTMPYFPTLIAIFGIAGSSILFLSSIKDNIIAKLIFSTIFITAPIHTYYLAFNTSGYYYTIGMVLTTFAYLSFKNAIESNKIDWKYYMISIFLIAFSLSLYQALLAFFLVFVAYYTLNFTIQQPKIYLNQILKIILSLVIICGFGFLIYKLGDIITRYYLTDPISKGHTSYLEKFTTWGKWPIDQTFKHLFLSTKQYLFGKNIYTGEFGLSIKTLMVIFPFISYFIIRKTSGYFAKFVAFLLLIILILSPFVVMYLNGFNLPARALMSLPLMIAILWLMTYRYAGPFLRRIIILSAFVILINNTYTNTRLFYSTYISWQADRDMANRIIERIYNLNPPMVANHIQVLFVGKHEHTANELFFKSDVHGASFFEWNPGTQYRIISFFRTLGMEELIAIPKEERAQYKDQISKMPSWPSKGSVNLIDSVTIIKLSEPIKN